jgi:predicted dehydrogenase
MPSTRPARISRRQFNRSALFGTVGALAAPAILRGQNLNSKLDIAMVACGGRGGANLREVEGENIVALCDVNGQAVERAGGKFGKAKRFTDFRKLFDEMEKSIDAVVVSTCEHTHALAVMAALRAGKHVYCEKPLTHDIYEARQVREMAAKTKVATQMGIQMHATENYRRVVEIIKSGAIGPVREAHVWVSRAWGLQSKESSDKYKDIVYVTDRPKEAQTPPSYLDWDLWLGPAPERPFNEVYFPGPKWYRWWDFGNGTMSDLGSHWNDLVFWALDLKAPLTVEAKDASAPLHPEIAPASMTAVYEYGPRGDGEQAMPAVKVYWHQGENKPEIWKSGGIPQFGDGHLFIGDKGMLLSNYEKYVLLPEKDFKDYKAPPRTLPRPGEHHKEWVECCKTGRQPSANFQYSGWLTEANHLGNVAFRAGKKLQWDATAMKATNAPEADQYIRRPYRKGWEL